MSWLLFSLLITLIYIGLIVYYHYHWSRLPRYSDYNEKDPVTKVSIIIVGRNEAENIENCLNSIEGNNYPTDLFEIIYVDDHSEDASIEILKALPASNLQILELKDYLKENRVNAYKKEAIKYALTFASGELILHTDADTVVEKNWIRVHVYAFEKNSPNFIAAPVFFMAEQSIIHQFQYLDFITTMGVTGAGIHSGLHCMANGANMSYARSFIDNHTLTESDYASGDDMFLVHKASTIDPTKVLFLNNEQASVKTYPENSWSDFFRQRVRWATKTRAYEDKSLKFVVILVFIANTILIANLIAGLFYLPYFYLFIWLFILKSIADISFINKVRCSFNLKISSRYLFISLLVYPFCYLTIGLAGIFVRKYKWKSREVR